MLALGSGAYVVYTVALHITRLYITAGAVIPKGPMVRLTLHHLMRERGISAYALSRGTGLSYPSAYRMSRPAGTFGRLHADTLERLCEFFQLQPGELLRWTPGSSNGRKGGKAGNGRRRSP